MDFLKPAFSDLFDIRIIKYYLAPLLISIFFWGVVFYFFSDDLTSFVYSYISHLPFGEYINSILTKIGSTVLLVFLYYELTILSIGVFSSLFVDKVTVIINEKHYHVPVRKSNLLEGIWVSIKALIILVIFFFFTFYFIFIPVLNIFYQVFLWSIAVKKPLVFDSTALFCDYKQFEKKNNLNIWMLVYITSFIYFIPIVSFFGYMIQLVFVTHYVLNKCKTQM